MSLGELEEAGVTAKSVLPTPKPDPRGSLARCWAKTEGKVFHPCSLITPRIVCPHEGLSGQRLILLFLHGPEWQGSRSRLRFLGVALTTFSSLLLPLVFTVESCNCLLLSRHRSPGALIAFPFMGCRQKAHQVEDSKDPQAVQKSQLQEQITYYYYYFFS